MLVFSSCRHKITNQTGSFFFILLVSRPFIPWDDTVDYITNVLYLQALPTTFDNCNWFQSPVSSNAVVNCVVGWFVNSLVSMRPIWRYSPSLLRAQQMRLSRKGIHVAGVPCFLVSDYAHIIDTRLTLSDLRLKKGPTDLRLKKGPTSSSANMTPGKLLCGDTLYHGTVILYPPSHTW